MALPKIEYPEFRETIPSTNEEVWFRPFTHKEEKILLIAEESKDYIDILHATKQVLTNCFKFKGDINNLTTYDIDYLFLKIRAKSISPISEIGYRVMECPKNDLEPCEKTIKVSINLDDVTLQQYDKETDQYVAYAPKNQVAGGFKIQLSDEVGVIIKHPGFVEKELFAKLTNPTKDELIKLCIVSVYDTNTVYAKDDFTPEELDTFYEDLILEKKQLMYDFVDNIPNLRFEKTLKCTTCGFTENLIYESLEDFFD